MRVMIVVALALAAAALPAPEESASPLQPLHYFIGTWAGRESASFGSGAGDRTYSLIVKQAYLLSRNRSVYPPNEKLPEGDVHEDWTIFSFDKHRDTYVVRQFNSEGYVNRFVLDRETSVVPRRMVFESEASENAPPGLRARLTYEVLGDDRFREVFELARPGQEFAVVLTNLWDRSR